MKIRSFRKSGATVLRVLDEQVAEVSLPGYTQTLVVDFANPQHVGSESRSPLPAVAGAKMDLYLTPAYLIQHGITPDQAVIKWPDRGGGSYAEQWRAWSLFGCLDESGPVAASLRVIRDEVKGGSLSACAAQFAAGETARARGTLDRLALRASKAVRSARQLLAPGDRSDSRQVASVMQAAIVGVLAEAC